MYSWESFIKHRVGEDLNRRKGSGTSWTWHPVKQTKHSTVQRCLAASNHLNDLYSSFPVPSERICNSYEIYQGRKRVKVWTGSSLQKFILYSMITGPLSCWIKVHSNCPWIVQGTRRHEPGKHRIVPFRGCFETEIPSPGFFGLFTGRDCYCSSTNYLINPFLVKQTLILLVFRRSKIIDKWLVIQNIQVHPASNSLPMVGLVTVGRL